MAVQASVVRLGIAALAVLAAGCVSSAETKSASTQYKAALDSYTRSVGAFEDAWVAEIDLLIEDLGNALSARAVTARIRSLSAEYDGFSNRDWEREVARNGLITLSEAINNERDRVHAALQRLEAIEIPDVDDPAAAIQQVLATYRAESIEAINSVPLLPDEERERLLAEAEAPFGNDAVANAMVDMIITWRMARDAIPGDLENLRVVLAALKTAHASVDQWIQTDVSVPGEELGTLVRTWSQTVKQP